jgi:hypothetical protein
MKDIPADQSASPQEDIDKDLKDFQKYKAEQQAQLEKELAEERQKRKEHPGLPWQKDPGVMSMRGPEDQRVEPEEEKPSDDVEYEASGAPIQSGSEPSRAEESIESPGASSISPDLLAAIAETNGMQSPEERKQAVAEMNKKFRNEINNIGGIVEDGKGVTFTDYGSGKKYTISYE